MDKIERYVEYVAKDILQNTEINFNKKTIRFPFLTTMYPHLPSITNLYYTHPSVKRYFNPYVEQRYGVREEEMPFLWRKLCYLIINGI